MPPLSPLALMLHLTLSSLPLLAWSDASAPWKPAFPLIPDPDALRHALRRETQRRASLLHHGLARLAHDAPPRASRPPPAAVWRQGSVRLLRYAPTGKSVTDGPVVVLVPSLINRYYILDLERGISFARYLAASGLRPFLLDWGSPGDAEAGFDCDAYVTQRLLPSLSWLAAETGGPLLLAGYCMGGLLALAAAGLAGREVQGLACFATPWDFSEGAFPHFPFDDALFEAMLLAWGDETCLSADIVQFLFHYAHPFGFQQRMRQLSRMNVARPSTQRFLAIERWAHDSVKMTRGVARDCFLHWGRDNAPHAGNWKVGGETVAPQRLAMPCFVAASTGDAIVPHKSAEALAARLPRPHLVTSQCGHVGMMVGRSRMQALWRPFRDWALEAC